MQFLVCDIVYMSFFSGGGRGGGKFGRSNCPCPNCQELERLGPAAAHLRKKNTHCCHIPGCGKVYNKVIILYNLSSLGQSLTLA